MSRSESLTRNVYIRHGVILQGERHLSLAYCQYRYSTLYCQHGIHQSTSCDRSPQIKTLTQ